MALISYRDQFPVNFEGVMFTGTMKKLLGELEPHRPDSETWIKSPKGLANALRRLIPVLNLNGIRVDFDNKPKKDGYHVHIRSIKTDME